MIPPSNSRTYILLLALTLTGCADLKTARHSYQDEDYVTARKNVEKLTALGFPEAETLLGEMYMNGRGVSADPAKAMTLFRHAEATEHYPGAILDIGKAYMNGTGVPKNLALAKKNFDRALALGNLDAYMQLGLLEQNNGRYAAAEGYFKTSLTHGDIKSWRCLGNLHMIQNKPDLAEEDFTRGIAAGDTQAYADLGRLYYQEKKWTLAEENYTKSLATGNLGAYIQLGDIQIELKKFSAALTNYKKAIDAGIPKGALKIGEMYKQGKGRPVDDVQALHWFYRARKLGVPDMNVKISRTEKKLSPEDLARSLQLTASSRE
jgi:TPR repeat protein